MESLEGKCVKATGTTTALKGITKQIQLLHCMF